MPSLFAERRARQRAAAGDAQKSSGREDENFQVIRQEGLVMGGVAEYPHRNVTQPVASFSSGFPCVDTLDESDLLLARRPARDVLNRECKPGMDSEIHEENLAKISAMTDKERAEAEQDILTSMSPALIELFRKRAEARYASNVDNHGNDSTPKRHDNTETLDQHDEIELKKMEWTLPLPRQPDGDAHSSPRFDFNGMIISKKVDMPEYLGLHHHGEHPHEAGYTIEELSHLIRSSVPSQRVIAMSTLGRIISNCGSSAISDQNTLVTVLSSLKRCKTLILLRCAADDNNVTAIAAAVEALSFCLNPLFDRVEGSHIASEVLLTIMDDLSRKKRKRIVDDQDASTSTTMEQFSAYMNTDLADGLYATNIVARLSHVLCAGFLPHSANVSILVLLQLLCDRIDAAALDIVSNDRLIHMLLDKFIRIDWPKQSAAEISDCLMSVRLLRSLHVNCNAIATLSTHSTCDSVMRFISVLPEGVAPEFRQQTLLLQSEVFHILSLYLQSGLGFTEFQEYHRLLVEYGRLTSEYLNGTLPGEENGGHDFIWCCSFWHMIASLDKAFKDPRELSDMLSAFVSYAFKFCDRLAAYLNSDRIHSAVIISVATSVIKVLTAYSANTGVTSEGSNGIDSSALKSLVNEFTCPQFLHGNAVKDALANIERLSRSPVDVQSAQFLAGVNVAESQRYLARSGAQLFFLESLVRLSEKFSVPEDSPVELSFSILDKLGNIGIAAALSSPLMELMFACIFTTASAEQLLAFSVTFLSVSGRCSKDFKSHRKRILINLFSSDSLGRLGITVSESGLIDELIVTCEKDSGHIAPITKLEWLLEALTVAKGENGLECISILLRLLLKLQGLSFCGTPPVYLFFRLLSLFLLETATGEAVYLVPPIAESLHNLLDSIVPLLQQISEPVSDSSFFDAYLNALRVYGAASYGNKLFTRYIVVPTAMSFAYDFRLAFWCELFELIPRLDFTLSEGYMEFYLYPKELCGAVLEQYMKALVNGLLDSPNFFRNVATHHVGHFLFHHVPRNEEEVMLQRRMSTSAPSAVVTNIRQLVNKYQY